MRIHSEQERLLAEQTLKEVMSKLEEALKLAREQEAQRETCSTGTHA
ncbi:MAG TPA: hypothetical protein VFL13_02245 [Candidatus Baltobacteraceae bacterium]|nr:hypothetical protein [Candidatus Baltobacteraceae bacterium]